MTRVLEFAVRARRLSGTGSYKSRVGSGTACGVAGVAELAVASVAGGALGALTSAEGACDNRNTIDEISAAPINTTSAATESAHQRSVLAGSILPLLHGALREDSTFHTACVTAAMNGAFLVH